MLPPVENPLQLVSRSQWDPSNEDQSALRSFPYRLRSVTVVHTATDQCNSTESCCKLLLEIQVNILSEYIFFDTFSCFMDLETFMHHLPFMALLSMVLIVSVISRQRFNDYMCCFAFCWLSSFDGKIMHISEFFDADVFTFKFRHVIWQTIWPVEVLVFKFSRITPRFSLVLE